MGARDVLRHLLKGDDGSFGSARPTNTQTTEHLLREKLASRDYVNYIREVAQHHSVEVMDREVREFVTALSRNALVCDVGGCWGWHWRKLRSLRPDVRVIIVDFVRRNLVHAQRLLGDELAANIWLVHGDATQLDFPDASFDAYWSVQVLQHIPDADTAIQEANRVLKPGGSFAKFSLNNARTLAWLCREIGRLYIVEGLVSHNFYLRRPDDRQRHQAEEPFGTGVSIRKARLSSSPSLGCLV